MRALFPRYTFCLVLLALAAGPAVETAQDRAPTSAAATAPVAPVAAVKEEDSRVTIQQLPIHPTPIQIDVNLVVVNVTVTDPYDRIVTGLDESNFQVYDERVEQKIASFSTEDAPISVGLVFDSSGSMSDKIQKSKEAALQFFKTSNPQDEFMLINFSERPNLVSGFTSKFENLQDRLLFVKSGGKTALLDAIYLGMSEMKKATTNRKALLVISDGGDNHSRYTENDVKRAVKESDVQIYVVGVFEPLASRDGGVGFVVESERDRDVRADLVRLVTGKNWALQELHQVGMSLEEVFIRVVAGEQVAPDVVAAEEEAR